MTQELTRLSLVEARDGLRRKEYTSTEITQAHFQEMARLSHLNAYITVTEEEGMVQAKTSDERLAAGSTNLLEGIPLAIKDLFCTKDVRTTAGSKILDNFIPPYESTVSANLWKAGAVMLGKTNMDEFAMGSSNMTSAYGPAINPWRRNNDPALDLVPGGSSGGSTAAVAAYMALGATASDTGGSIRQPAAFTGLVGMKPTYGLCSRRGMVAFASSLDQAGPVTRTVADTALMLQCMAGHDPLDATSLKVNIPDYLGQMQESLKGLKVGIPKEYREGLTPDMQALLEKGMEWLTDAGATLVDVSLPTSHLALPTYYIIAPAEASSNLARYDGVRYGVRVPGSTLDEMYENTRAAGFGHEVQRRIFIGTYVLSHGYYDAYYLQAQKVRTLIVQDFDRVFQEVDLLLTPTTPGEAFALKEKPTDPVQMFLNDIFTVTVNLAALPAISVPAGLSAKHELPLGLQLIGPKLSEQTLLNGALAIERRADFQTQAKRRLI